MKKPDSPYVHVLLIMALGLLAYSNAFEVPFQFDDLIYLENPVAADFYKFYQSSQESPYSAKNILKLRHITNLTFLANNSLHGPHVLGYHLINLAIHLLNSLMVYLLVLLTFRTREFKGSSFARHGPSVALFSSALFVCHPLQTQAVTYITQRFASLATLFYLLSLLGYVGARLSNGRKPRALLYIISVVSAVLAMKSKEIAFTLPLAIALYEFMFLGGSGESSRKRVLRLIPFLCIMLIVPASLLGHGHSLAETLANATRTQTEITRHDYLLTEFRVLVTYLRLFFLPINQSLDYDYPLYASFIDPSVLGSFIALAALFAGGVVCRVRARRGRPELLLAAFGVFWFFLTISVESSFIALADVIFEHRLYLPSVGLFLLLAACLFILKDALNPTAFGKALTAFMAVLVLALGLATYSRNAVWQSEITLWKDAVSKAPGKARSHINLAMAYNLHDMLDMAIRQFSIATQLDPDNELVHVNLAYFSDKKGFKDKAIEHYLAALRLNPKNYRVRNNLGVIYTASGLIDEGIKHSTEAINLNPEFVEAYNNRCLSYNIKSQFDWAIDDCNKAIMMRPDYDIAYFNRGVAFAGKGLYDRAIEDLTVAVSMKPDFGEAYYNRGVIHEMLGDGEKARADFEAACGYGNQQGCAALKDLPTEQGSRQ